MIIACARAFKGRMITSKFVMSGGRKRPAMVAFLYNRSECAQCNKDCEARTFRPSKSFVLGELKRMGPREG